MKRVRIADIIPPILHKDVMSESLFKSQFHILIYESHDNRGMIIGIDAFEAKTLALTILDKANERRKVYDLFEKFFLNTGWTFEGVYITGSVTGGPLETKIRLRKGQEKQELSCLPSDGFILANQCKAPIYIINEMLDKFSFVIPEKFKDIPPLERGINEIYLEVKKQAAALDKEFQQMSIKASKKSIEAYAESSKEVMKYVFGYLVK